MISLLLGLLWASEITLERPMEAERLGNGHTLIADAGGRAWQKKGSKVIEVDEKGGVVWTYEDGLVFAHSAKILSNGNLIIADTGNNRLIEVNRDKELVWQSNFSLSYPNDVDILENGHFLVTDRNHNRVIEIDRQGNVYWQYTDLNRPHNADRLENGDTLISDSERNKVIRVNLKGEIVWEYGSKDSALYWPRDIDLFGNNNYLITDSKNQRVVEIDDQGETVKEFKGFLSFPYEADYLGNGNILISVSSQARVVEVNSQGEIIWQYGESPLPQYSNFTNTGFEKDQDQDNFPDGWQKGDLLTEGEAYQFGIDKNVFYQGKQSLKLEYAGKGMLFTHQYLDLKPGKNYLLAGYYKCQDLQKEARAEVIFLDELGGQIGLSAPSSGCLKTSDWQEFRLDFQVPEKTASVNLWLVQDGPGTAWFDQMSLSSGFWADILRWQVGVGLFAGVTFGWILHRIGLRKK
ncbi:MAG: NHL repeat-containing protein [Candidatus Shapirobacteria bacterium]